METSKRHGLQMRGDSLYCPLSFSLDSYWMCLVNCRHCWIRRLNRTWGKDLRPTNIEILDKKLFNGVRNKKPQTAIAWALKNKNTLRWGNKSDPFQPIEKKYRISEKIFDILLNHDWSFVIHTLCTGLMMEYEDKIRDIINAEIDKEIEDRIKNYCVRVNDGYGNDLDIESIDFSGGEINIILEQ